MTRLVVLAAVGTVVVAVARPHRAEDREVVACALADVDRATAPVAACEACHGRHAETFALSATHPVDVEYDREARVASGERRLRRASELPADIVLVDGVVTCTTCHDGRSSEPFRLARSGARALCVSCHLMQDDGLLAAGF